MTTGKNLKGHVRMAINHHQQQSVFGDHTVHYTSVTFGAKGLRRPRWINYRARATEKKFLLLYGVGTRLSQLVKQAVCMQDVLKWRCDPQ
jgi:hypothetical protein